MGREKEGGQSGEERMAKRLGRMSLTRMGERKAAPPNPKR